MQKKYAAIVAVVAILAAVIIIAAGNTKKEVKAVAPLVRTQVIRLDGSGQGASYSGEVRGVRNAAFFPGERQDCSPECGARQQRSSRRCFVGDRLQGYSANREHYLGSGVFGAVAAKPCRDKP